MNIKNYYSLALLFAIILAGCNKIEENREQTFIQNTTNTDKEISYAIELVKEFSDKVNKSPYKTKSSSDSEIDITLEKYKTLKFNFPSTKGQNRTDSINLYTFILEKNGNLGFAIASGDERIGNVYAYVENGSLSDTSYIRGMAYMISNIPYICQHDLYNYQNKPTKSFLDGFSGTIGRPNGLISTEWSQDPPYNWGTPSSTCTSGYYPAGCGVIAVAQIVAYYKKCDKKFDFNALTENKTIKRTSSFYLTNEVSKFIAYIGEKCKADYGCDETVTYMGSGCLTALSSFGYTYTSTHGSMYGNKNTYNKVRQCIENGNVIIAIGQDTGGAGGHFWIVDGFIPSFTKSDANEIHCNWGWGGISNGWYNDFNEADVFAHPYKQPYNFSDGLYYYYLDIK